MVLGVVVFDGSFLLQDCNTLRSLRLQEVGFARLLSLVVWLLLLLIMVPNMALPIKQVQVQQLHRVGVLTHSGKLLARSHHAVLQLRYTATLVNHVLNMSY